MDVALSRRKLGFDSPWERHCARFSLIFHGFFAIVSPFGADWSEFWLESWLESAFERGADGPLQQQW